MTDPLAVIPLVVAARDQLAREIIGLELVRADGGALPRFAPGAHLDLLLPDGVERQYSLCGDPAADRWRIAVLLEEEGRGGSAWVHEHLVPGAELGARGPHSHFALDPVTTAPVRFVAGGVGITPILPMVREAARTGMDWRLLYAGRSRESMAFVAELEQEWPERIEVFAADEGQRLDLASALAEAGEGVTLYCCGPARLLDLADALCGEWPAGRYHRERFEARTQAEPQREEPFEVELQLSGQTVTVPPGRSILEAVEEVGAFVLSSCREGTCGTCETVIVSGEADHRDAVLSPQQQAENRVMMICVSRAACPRLVLEL